MIFWLIAILVLILTGAALILPLLRRAPAVPEATRGLAIYRDQLAEIERDQEAGLITETEAGSARTEIERRILKAAEQQPERAASEPGVRMFLAGLILGAVPAATVALYLAVGTPNAPDLAMSVASDEAMTADQLADLARRQVAQDRLTQAVETFTRAAARAPHRADLRSLLGEVRVAAADGNVTELAQLAFREAISLDPRDPRARFYLGLARAQEGDLKGAIDDWLRFEADSGTDAAWRPMLAERLKLAAAEAGIDLEARRAELAPRGPTAADVAAAQQMSPADRQQMVRGMVDGLAARLADNPGDVEGWLRLARARRVLGEESDATEALRRATEAAPTRVDVLVEYARALHPPGSAPEAVTPDFVTLMRRILALDSNNPEALFFVGEAEARAGNKTEAKALWGRLLARVDPKESLHKIINERIKALD
jgi:cytochrome c-type biogenesis protein CcmH